MSLLDVSNLTVAYVGDGPPVWAVRDASFDLDAGRVLGVVGESGSGKTTLAMSLIGLLRPPGRVVRGEVRFAGEALLAQPPAELRRIRGARIALVPQASMNALDPVHRVRSLVAEAIRAHQDVGRDEAGERALSLLRSVGIPPRRVDAYPHELSGGMRQRVVIAMALANDPALLIADEPVTGLDVIVQAQILELLRESRRRRELSMILISHDLPVVASLADTLLVMRDGHVVEQGPTERLMSAPEHPYTQALVAAIPRLRDARTPREPAAPEAVLRFADVRKTFVRRSLFLRRSVVRAVDGVSLEVRRGEIVGLIGESGSGKTTLARLALGLVAPDSGDVVFSGESIARLGERRVRTYRRRMHLIFQDPYEALSPRTRVRDLVGEPLVIHGVRSRRERELRVVEALAESGLEPAEEFLPRYPHELSGGQRQRVALARALVLRPSLIVADEPTSMLDVPLRAGLLRTMETLRARHGISFLFITHDLVLAAGFCDRAAVMLRGRLVELAPVARLAESPRHPYTQALMRAVRDLRPPADRGYAADAEGPVHALREVERGHFVATGFGKEET